ncbi:MAG TPA: uracil-DNA glycosylase [bacterium]|jgi:DNA polymerase|nr:uracil-DNA glycosylase [bacterium]
MISKDLLLKSIHEKIVNLKKSPLYSFRVKNNYQVVSGEGSPEAKIVFIGEAPGKNEALTGKPFCGASGRVLDQLLASVKIKREAVFITSIVKDRPPENRDPSPKEIALYTPFLIEQLEVIKPKMIVTLGRHAMNFILKEFGLELQLKPISEAHGQPVQAVTSWGKITILPLYHPAVALYNGSTRKILEADFKQLTSVR